MLLKHDSPFSRNLPASCDSLSFLLTLRSLYVARKSDEYQTLHVKMYYNEEWELRIMENRKEQLVWKIAVFIPHLQMFLFNGDAR